ncbi:hypothetical protein Trydic_g20887 [Trypoxylus dichotomus]
MNSEEAVTKSDFFLREIPNVKISTSAQNDKKPPVKEELKVLNLTNHSQELIMETLMEIHGPNFSLNNASCYEDKGDVVSKKYWMDRGNLVIKGIMHHSNNENDNDCDIDKFKLFAIMRLESYGFHKEHCEEALDCCMEIEDALELLYSKYFNVKKKEKNEDFCEKELIEQRIDEKNALESIYETAFTEKIKNQTNLLMPKQMNLHICKRLYQEAEVLALDGMASIYSIAELLKNDVEIKNYIANTPLKFLNANEKLFPKVKDNNINVVRETHYIRGTTSKQKLTVTQDRVNEDNQKLVKQHKSRLNDEKYKTMIDYRKKLPAWQMKEDILTAIRVSKVVVISGETGCGKSTQVPQFILDEWLNNYSKVDKKHVEIICTQPRRISAIGVAERVADERIERIGQTIGYQIRLENKISTLTRLTFCTTGILLRRLEVDSLLCNVTHIIVDEVHERSVESDFLLLILKDLLIKRPDLRIILMSATLNANLFSDYFGNIPILEIPGRTFPVEQLFLEDILDLSDFVLEENTQYTRKVKGNECDLDAEIASCDVTSPNSKPKDIIKDENLTIAQVLARYQRCKIKTCKNMYLMDVDKVNLDLIESILSWIVSGNHTYPKTGTILIFLPGISEITALYQQLQDHPDFSNRSGNYMLVPLHSSLSSEEQALVFKKPKDGVRKIVISTNIAETSITIDDCVYVIDSGKMKEKGFDSNRNMESLDTVWVTKANALQRKGRAGRVMSGVSIHLFTSHRYEHHLMGQPIPEIKRVPLEQLILHIKILPNFKNKTAEEVLGSVLETPTSESISAAIRRLQYVGALDKCNSLTPLGHHLATLPVDVKIGKLMLYGAIFGCVDSALTIAACLSHKSPFTSPFGKKEKVDAKKKEFSHGYSDQITTLNAYKKWLAAHRKSYFAGQNFANENYLSHKTLLTLADIKHQYLELLVSIDFVPVNLKAKRKPGDDQVLSLTGTNFNKNGDNVRLLSAILCAALYPNIVIISTPEKSFSYSAAGAVPKQPEAKELKFKTNPYLVYQEKVKTSKIYVRDCSMIPVISMILFSGFDVHINVHNSVTFIVLDDGWIVFKVEEHKIAEMVKILRLELVALLEEKIGDPLLNLMHNTKGERIISTILHLVSNE